MGNFSPIRTSSFRVANDGMILKDGSYSITTLDEFADSLLSDERVCEIQLPRITQRRVLEETEGLTERRSKLGQALGVIGAGVTKGDEEEDEIEEGGEERERYVSRSPSRSRSPTPDRSRSRSLSRSGSEGGYISRSPTRSPERIIIDDDERIEGDA
jgi:pre-mRNA-splicing factor 38A